MRARAAPELVREARGDTSLQISLQAALADVDRAAS